MIWFIWWFICVLPLVTIDIGPIGVRTSWKPKTNPLKPVWWAKSSWLHHGCFDSHVSIIWCVIYICHIHSLISLYIYLFIWYNYILRALPSCSKVLSFDPTDTNRQSLPDPHHARPAFDGERTAVPPQLMFDTRDMGFVHVGIGAYKWINR